MPQRFDEIYKALADTHRRRILSAVCREPIVAGELARLVQLAPNAVSFHLKWLRSAGLVTVRRQGKYLHYAADPAGVGALQRHVHELFSPLANLDLEGPASEFPAAASARNARPRSEAGEHSARAAVESEEEPLPTELL